MPTLSPHLAGKLLPMSDATTSLLAEETRLYETDRLAISITYDKLDREVPLRKFVMRSYPVDHESPVSPFAKTGFVHRIPGARLRADGYVEAPITDTTVLCCIAMWGKDRLDFDDEAHMEFQIKFLQFFNSQKIAEYIAGWKKDKTVPEHAPKGTEGKPPMPQQRVAALCMIECDEAVNLHMEMRTGKTYAAVMAMDADCEKHPHAMNIVFCPKNVRSSWVDQIKAFTSKNVNVVALRRSKIRRMKSLLEANLDRGEYDYTVVIISYDGLDGTLNPLKAFKWRWGIADEAHFFKQQRTERWKNMVKLRDNCEKRAGLTGTPICNSAMDLYTQFEWLGSSFSGFHSFEEFAKFYGVLKKVKRRKGGYDKILVGMQNVPLLQERMARSCYHVTKKEALPHLPPVSNKIIDIEMTDVQKDIYKQVALKIQAEIEGDLDGDGRTITVNNILTKLLRLHQITSGFVAVDGEIDLETGDVLTHEIDRFDPNPKVEALIEYLKEKQEQQEEGEPVGKTLIWCAFVENCKQIRARLELEGIKCVAFFGKMTEQQGIDARTAFNEDPSVLCYVGTSTKGGIGINLNGRCDDHNGNRRAQCDSIWYYSQGWSMPVRQQSQARPMDMKCEWPIEVVDACVFGTVDFDIRDRVTGKINHAMQMQDVRHLLKRLIPE